MASIKINSVPTCACDFQWRHREVFSHGFIDNLWGKNVLYSVVCDIMEVLPKGTIGQHPEFLHLCEIIGTLCSTMVALCIQLVHVA